MWGQACVPPFAPENEESPEGPQPLYRAAHRALRGRKVSYPSFQSLGPTLCAHEGTEAQTRGTAGRSDLKFTAEL